MTKLEFQNIFDSLYNPLCNYANAIVGDFDKAEDIVQDVLLNFWNKRLSLKIASDKIEHYLIRSVKLKCIDIHRHAAIKRKYENEIKHTTHFEIDEQVDEQPDYKAILFNTISLLPKKTREVFILSKIDGLKYNEIAEKLDISPKTVENQMGRAFKHIRELLKNEKLYILFIFILTMSRG